MIYNADQFLKYAKDKGLVPELKDRTIEEVKDIRISDEKKNLYKYKATLDLLPYAKIPEKMSNYQMFKKLNDQTKWIISQLENAKYYGGGLPKEGNGENNENEQPESE